MSEGKHTAGSRRAVKGPDPKYAGEAPENVGFVLGGDDGKTVIGRFPRYEDAVLDAAAPDLLAALSWAVEQLAELNITEETPGALGKLNEARAAISHAKATATP